MLGCVTCCVFLEGGGEVRIGFEDGVFSFCLIVVISKNGYRKLEGGKPGDYIPVQDQLFISTPAEPQLSEDLV